MSALEKQINGNHYKSLTIQPVEYIHANNIPFLEGNVIKYVTRWRNKNGIADLEKAKHYIELLIELESSHSLSC
jgi:UDP-3-O-acyl-N-acetylglucosamine deacetylase